MKTLLKETVSMPNWAVSYIEYGDTGELSESEVEMIDDAMSKYHSLGEVLISYGESNYFTHHPLFGLPCDCTDTVIVVCK